MSELIVWEDRYSIGVAKIDEQHKTLFGFLNSYYESLATGKSAEMISLTLRNLIDYASYHFKDEEEWMSIIPGYDSHDHLEQHDDFISKVLELQSLNALGKNISFELFDFMKEWILNHILISDLKLGVASKK